MVFWHLAKHDFGWRFFILVELSDKRSDNFAGRGVGKMRKEIGPVAIIGPAPYKENLNTASLATAGDGNDIGIANLGQIYILIGLNAGKGANPVTPDGGALKISFSAASCMRVAYSR